MKLWKNEIIQNYSIYSFDHFLYDFKVRFIKKINLPVQEQSVLEISPYTIHNNSIYQMVENESDEMWELKITSLKNI